MVASSTAVVYISSWRSATAGMPNLFCTISPCTGQTRASDITAAKRTMLSPEKSTRQ